MPIENRNLEPGTVLVARHKKEEHRCEVVQTDAGLRYRLADGKEFNSPSSAGREITGGVAVNGWRFWSLEGDLKPRTVKADRPAKEEKPAKKPATEKAAAKKAPAKKSSPKKKGARKPAKKAARAASRASFGCGVCGDEFPTMKAATDHAAKAHVGN